MNLRLLLPAVNVLITPLWWVLTAIWIASRRLPTSKRRVKQVLLVTHNELMARYLREVADLIRDDEGIALNVARAPFADSAVPLEQIVKRVEATPVPFWRALTRRWDLIVFADHYPASLFHPRIKKLFVSHGLFAGIILGGSNYIYGARAVRRTGVPMFSKMLASGPAEARCALNINPVLEDTLAFVGSPTVDRLRERARRRAEIRAALGIGTDDVVVMMMSSWGEQSLIQTVGTSLVEAAQGLTDRYHFILTIHPNNYTRAADETDWAAFMARQAGPRFSVVGQYDDWEDFVVAADIGVTDYTSLALYLAQRLRPLIFVPVDLSRFVPGAPIALLYEFSPKLDDVGDLDRSLREALSEFSVEKATELARDVVAYPGEGDERMRREILDLLR
jgi:hypothetical protein